jgi:hypothetical protein
MPLVGALLVRHIESHGEQGITRNPYRMSWQAGDHVLESTDRIGTPCQSLEYCCFVIEATLEGWTIVGDHASAFLRPLTNADKTTYSDPRLA